MSFERTIPPPLLNSSRSLNLPHQRLQFLVLIPPASAAPIDHNLTLLLLALLGHGAQDILQLVLAHFLPDLARPRQHDEPVLDIRGARLFDEPDAAQPVGGFGGQDLGEDVCALVGCETDRELVRFCVCFGGVVQM